jgi:DNA-binding transcriptional LysR family regulator
MIFDKELDYLSEIGAERVQLASNSVSVQLGFLRQGAGIGIAHDFALPFAPELRKLMTGQISLTRSFYLIRHADDARVERLNRVADSLMRGIRAEVARLEALT